MLRIAVCDDEESIIRYVVETIQKYFRLNCLECKIQTYQDSENLYYDIRDGIQYDLFFLDIEIPKLNGMELAKEISDNNLGKIIFITSHLEYAITAYEYSVFRYIPKNMLDEKLDLALDDFLKLYYLERSEYYRIEIKNHVEKIPYRDILYVLKDGKYAIFYLCGERSVRIRKTLKQILEEIKKEYFFLADQGCIVNLANVVGLDSEGVIFADQKHIAISKAKVTAFKKTMLKFWERHV